MTVRLELRRILTLILASLVLLLSHLGDALAADAESPLAPADTSSPRATLTGFVETVATILSIAILVIGAQHLGIPAYSVIAGLGVGGIAVALAAKDSLANLLGSLLIMFEKPFRVGHWIKVDNIEGIVESIGFRSTRIRTFYNSLISIPSNHLVNTTVDNMAMRELRAVRTTLYLSYAIPADKVERFVTAIKQLIESGPYTSEKKLRVRFDDVGIEKAERQRILLEILKLAEAMDIQFAIPPCLQGRQG